MIEHNNGHIVTIASMAGHVGVAKLVDYCSSKAAACGFDEALRLELEVRGIKGVHTSLICPYFIRSTGMFEEVNSRWESTFICLFLFPIQKLFIILLIDFMCKYRVISIVTEKC